jgi:hypothetical protein
MDDLTTSPPAPCTVSRACEASRLQGQLLARAYQHVFPQVRRPIVDRTINPPAARFPENPSTAARMAAGA